MRRLSIAVAALVVSMSASCGGGPSGQDINDSLQDTLRSVSGNWVGVATGANGVRLEFRLQEAGNGQVSGSGTMKEQNAAAAVPITVSGTFQRPVLKLVFEGVVYETQAATGAAEGSYTTVGGISTTLLLTAPGYRREVALLLQEQ